MVFNGVLVQSVAHLSAATWQRVARIPSPDRISSREMLELVCCFPLQQIGRFVLWLWTYLCVPPPDSFYSYSYYSSSSFSDDDDGDGSSLSRSRVDLDDESYYHPHSD